MTVRRRTLRRSGDGGIRAFLAKPHSFDYFGELNALGEDRVREYWERHAADVMVEFRARYGGGAPLGTHLFDAATGE